MDTHGVSFKEKVGHDAWSPIKYFIEAVKNLEELSEDDHNTSNYPFQLPDDWIKFACKEDRLETHAQDCKLNQPPIALWCRQALQIQSEQAFKLQYGSRRADISFEDITKCTANYICNLHSWRHVLPPDLSWKDENISSLDSNLGQICCDYHKARSMALLPYLHWASRLPQRAAALDSDKSRLIDIASQCTLSAFRCVEVSAGIYNSLEHACCQDSRDYAIHE